MQVFFTHFFEAEHAMRPTEFKSFKAHVAMLLRDLPRGVTADLTDVAVAYWNGTQLFDAPRFSERADLKAAFVSGVMPANACGGLWPRPL
jgi:hypothetical protein